jgi:UDP-N-acetylglucosamine--N-acetylmuramyl-(pentapeptide) pyrophosphoryl-undecaprenol N-acetylglucosamine transferase
MEWIRVSGLRGKNWKRIVLAPGMLLYAFVQALSLLLRQKPGLVLGMGGFVSGPGGIAARCLRIPLLIHEQNAVPGTTNRWLAKIADQVLQGFPDSFPQVLQPLTTGNPVRPDIAALKSPAQRFAERRGTKARLLILGGSQGAQALNRSVPEALARLEVDARPDIWHQTGEAMYDDTLARYRKADITAHLVPFIEDMAQAYDWADTVLCRSGALTIAELTAAGVGAILVPFPFATDDHQTANAQFMVRAGAAVMLPQAELNAEHLAATLTAMLPDRQRLLKMAEAARGLAQQDAAEKVADLCLEILSRKKRLKKTRYL